MHTTDTLAEIADKAPGLFIDLSGIGAAETFEWKLDVARLSADLEAIAETATGRTVVIATNHADANLYERGNHFANVTRFFADDLERMLEDGEYWVAGEEEE